MGCGFKKADNIDNSIKILHSMLECNADCAGTFQPEFNLKCRPGEFLEWQHKNLPALTYVVNRITDYIFSNGFTTGDEELDVNVLDPWMYKANVDGVSNYDILKSAVQSLMIYGHCGVRWLDEENGVVKVESSQYGRLIDEDPVHRGVKKTIGYIIALKDDEYIWDIDLSEIEYSADYLEEYGIFMDEEERVMILPTDEFINMRWDPGDPEGRSPLLYDRQRLNLLISVYERLNYDIEYDGPGRILLHVSESAGNDWGNEVSTSKTLGSADKIKEDRADKIRNEIKQLGLQIKNSSSDAVIALSSAFGDKVTHLPRRTEATQFFDYISSEGEILSQVYGIPPALLELGKVFGNVSMQKIIDNAIMNSIIPIRETFAVQISNFLAPKLGLPKIFFNKYDLEQVADENDARATVADIISTLKDAGYDELADQFAELLGDDISEVDGVATLKASVSKKSLWDKITGGLRNGNKQTGTT